MCCPSEPSGCALSPSSFSRILITGLQHRNQEVITSSRTSMMSEAISWNWLTATKRTLSRRMTSVEVDRTTTLEVLVHLR